MKTVSVELSKQLQEAGYPQKAEYCWIKDHFDKYQTVESHIYRKAHSDCTGSGCGEFVAPTADEICDLLPAQLYLKYKDKKRYRFPLVIAHTYHVWNFPQYMVSYGNYPDLGLKKQPRVNDVILANAVAKMWLYLTENKLWKTQYIQT